MGTRLQVLEQETHNLMLNEELNIREIVVAHANLPSTSANSYMPISTCCTQYFFGPQSAPRTLESRFQIHAGRMAVASKANWCLSTFDRDSLCSEVVIFQHVKAPDQHPCCWRNQSPGGSQQTAFSTSSSEIGAASCRRHCR